MKKYGFYDAVVFNFVEKLSAMKGHLLFIPFKSVNPAVFDIFKISDVPIYYYY